MRRAKKSGDDGAGRSLIRTQNAVEMGFEEARLFTLAEPFRQYRNARGAIVTHRASSPPHKPLMASRVPSRVWLDDFIGRSDAQFTRNIELEMAVKMGGEAHLVNSAARIVRMKQ
jgi:hypothetical protein